MKEGMQASPRLHALSSPCPRYRDGVVYIPSGSKTCASCPTSGLLQLCGHVPHMGWWQPLHC